MHIYKIVYIKPFKIAPTCFDPKIIFRELRFSLLKLHFLKNTHWLINQWVFFKKCDFSKEQCNSPKIILGSKHVAAILNVLM